MVCYFDYVIGVQMNNQMGDISLRELIDRMRKGEQIEVELEPGDDFDLYMKAVEDILYAFDIDYVVGEYNYYIATEDEGSVHFWCGG